MKNSSGGFTLIEVMVSIAIIALISGSIFNMFTTSSRINKNANNIDMANLIASSEVEKIKRNPDQYVVEDNITNVHRDGDATTTTAVLKKYYDNQWEEVSDENEAMFTSTSTVVKHEILGEFSTYQPKMNKLYSKNKSIGNNENYLIVAVDNLDSTGAHKDKQLPHQYEIYTIEGYTYESFEEWVFDEESPDAFPKQWEIVLERYRGIRGEPGGIEHFLSLKGDGYNRIIGTALRHIQGEQHINFDKCNTDKRVLGSIPHYIEVVESNQFKRHNVEVVNLTSKEFDIYITNKLKPKKRPNFKVLSGDVNITYLSAERRGSLLYDIEVKITRNKDNSELIKHSVERYESDVIEDKR